LQLDASMPLTNVLAVALCPDCEPGRQARALFFGAQLVPTAIDTLLPFVVVLVVVLVVVRRLDRGR
jgi:hypothetical protein